MPNHGLDLSTELPEGLLLHDRLDQALAQGRRRNAPVALIHVDLDDPDSGDLESPAPAPQALAEIASRLRDVVRASDTVGRVEHAGLVLILPDLSRLAAAGLIAAKVLATLDEDPGAAGQEEGARANLGIATFPAHGDCAEALLRNAGCAAAEARTSGGRVRWFGGDAHTDPGPQRDLARDLAEAIDQGQLSLDYQPQIDLVSERLVGLEALLRWQHPALGAIDPEAFIRLAETSGQIGRIGKWVLTQACADAARWPTGRAGPVRVAVNLSTAQMVGDDLPQVIGRALEGAGLPAQRLELELTEHSMLDGGERLRAVLNQLRAMGVGLVLDDFGTGYASLRHLACFPLDGLKIDRSFVAKLTRPSHYAIVQSMIELAHRLGLRVIAEGVEHDAQLTALRALGCDEIQGHIHGKPLKAEALATWVPPRPDWQAAR
ncbi:MAG: GGDEF domain-containing phosphodiesterase [Pseudomonadota bacterium]